MLHFFGIASGIIALIAAFPYIRDILKNKTKPNQVSWFIFVLLQGIALFTQLASGATDSLLLTIGDVLASSTIFLLALFKGQAHWHWVDYFALVGAAIGLLLWYFSQQPVLALVMSIFVDFCGVIPTLRKAYVDPQSETLSTWFIVGFSGCLGALAVGEWNWVLLLYPLYLVVANWAVVVAILIANLKNRYR